MKPIQITASGSQTVQITEDTSYQVEYTVIGRVSYSPGKYYGPPENCYPDESECELTEIKITCVTGPAGEIALDKCNIPGIIKILDEDILEENLWEEFQKIPEPDYDYAEE